MLLAFIIAAVAVILDQISKFIVVESIALYETKPFINGFMSFYHTRNTGAAFSMLSNQRWVFMVVSFIVMGLIIYILAKEQHRHVFLNITLGMVLGGGIGNMIDRIRLGYVVDFFHTDFVDFAVFNVADCFITVGAILLGVYILFIDPRVEKRLQAEKQAHEAAAIETEAKNTEGNGENE